MNVAPTQRNSYFPPLRQIAVVGGAFSFAIQTIDLLAQTNSVSSIGIATVKLLCLAPLVKYAVECCHKEENLIKSTYTISLNNDVTFSLIPPNRQRGDWQIEVNFGNCTAKVNLDRQRNTTFYKNLLKFAIVSIDEHIVVAIGYEQYLMIFELSGKLRPTTRCYKMNTMIDKIRIITGACTVGININNSVDATCIIKLNRAML